MILAKITHPYLYLYGTGDERWCLTLPAGHWAEIAAALRDHEPLTLSWLTITPVPDGGVVFTVLYTVPPMTVAIGTEDRELLVKLFYGEQPVEELVEVEDVAG